MSADNDEVLKILVEIRDTLKRIYFCFRQDYVEARKQELGGKWEDFERLLSDERKAIYPLIFDSPSKSQTEIAEKLGVNQSTVSKFIGRLLDQGFIEPVKQEDGSIAYHDRYDLTELVRD